MSARDLPDRIDPELLLVVPRCHKAARASRGAHHPLAVVQKGGHNGTCRTVRNGGILRFFKAEQANPSSATISQTLIYDNLLYEMERLVADAIRAVGRLVGGNCSFFELADEESQGLTTRGVLDRLGRTSSRDHESNRHVEGVVAEVAQDVRDWVQRGAAIYVLGNVNGTARAVNGALREAPGEDRGESMVETSPYL